MFCGSLACERGRHISKSKEKRGSNKTFQLIFLTCQISENTKELKRASIIMGALTIFTVSGGIERTTASKGKIFDLT